MKYKPMVSLCWLAAREGIVLRRSAVLPTLVVRANHCDDPRRCAVAQQALHWELRFSSPAPRPGHP